MVCQGCLCVNPGQLTKGTGGGTYAELAVHPIPQDVLSKAEAGETNLNRDFDSEARTMPTYSIQCHDPQKFATLVRSCKRPMMVLSLLEVSRVQS